MHCEAVVRATDEPFCSLLIGLEPFDDEAQEGKGDDEMLKFRMPGKGVAVARRPRRKLGAVYESLILIIFVERTFRRAKGSV